MFFAEFEKKLPIKVLGANNRKESSRVRPVFIRPGQSNPRPTRFFPVDWYKFALCGQKNVLILVFRRLSDLSEFSTKKQTIYVYIS